MLVFAQCLLDRGVLIPRHHIVPQHRLLLGSLHLADRLDDEMKRYTRTARLLVPDVYATRRDSPQQIGKDLLPELHEATLIHWHDRVLTLSGFERVAGSGAAESSYRQSWLIRIPTAEEETEIRLGPAEQPQHPVGLSGQQLGQPA